MKTLAFVCITTIVVVGTVFAGLPDYKKVAVGDVVTHEAILVSVAEFAYLLRRDTDAGVLAAENAKLKADIRLLTEERNAAAADLAAERLARTAGVEACLEASACVCDMPWGGWPWVAGSLGLGLGGLAGFGLGRVIP